MRNCGCERVVPFVSVEPRGEEEGDGDEPRVGVDGDEGEPVPAVHPVAGEVDAERRLGQLRRHLLRRQRHLPAPVGEAVQAQILLIYKRQIRSAQSPHHHHHHHPDPPPPTRTRTNISPRAEIESTPSLNSPGSQSPKNSSTSARQHTRDRQTRSLALDLRRESVPHELEEADADADAGRPYLR